MKHLFNKGILIIHDTLVVNPDNWFDEGKIPLSLNSSYWKTPYVCQKSHRQPFAYKA